MFSDCKRNVHHEVREVKHCALNEDLFLQKPISNENLVREIDKKINGSRIRLHTKQKLLKEKKIVAITALKPLIQQHHYFSVSSVLSSFM